MHFWRVRTAVSMPTLIQTFSLARYDSLLAQNLKSKSERLLARSNFSTMHRRYSGFKLRTPNCRIVVCWASLLRAIFRQRFTRGGVCACANDDKHSVKTWCAWRLNCRCQFSVLSFVSVVRRKASCLTGSNLHDATISAA